MGGSASLHPDQFPRETQTMKSSARNHFAGTVVHIQSGVVNDELTLELHGGIRIVATMTSQSRKRLALEIGSPAFALVKAPSVVVLQGDADVLLSARNQLRGTVGSVQSGAVNSEVVIALADGIDVAAVKVWRHA